MKKNNSTETENIVMEPIMDEQQMQQYVEENIRMVPKNQIKKFESMTLQQKVSKIKFYYEMQKLREDARIKNSVPNRVKDLFEKRHATVEDAKAVLQYCTEFIDSAKDREIAAIDAEIAKLMQKKQSINI